VERTRKDREPELEGSEQVEEYEAPKVEELDTKGEPAVTAAGDSPYGAITLIEQDE
jgi:hypothetical protein